MAADPEPLRATLELRRRAEDDAPRGVITAAGHSLEFSGWLELSATIERLLTARDAAQAATPSTAR